MEIACRDWKLGQERKVCLSSAEVVGSSYCSAVLELEVKSHSFSIYLFIMKHCRQETSLTDIYLEMFHF